MSLRHKLFLSYALLVLGVLGGSAWSIYHFTVLGRSVRRIMSDNYRSVLDAQVMKEALERQDSAMLFHVAGHDEKALPQFEQNRKRFAQHYADAAANITEDGEPEVIRDIGQQFADFSRKTKAFMRNRLLSNAESRRYYFREVEPAFLRLKDRCQDLLELNQDAMVRKQREAERQAGGASRATSVLSFGLLLLGMAYSIKLSRALVAPLDGLTAGAKRIGEGDLDLKIEVKTGDEVETLAQEFNRMAARLREYREREAARLQVAEEKSDAAINSLYEPVIVTGPEGEVIGLNRAAEPLFGPEAGRLQRPVEALGVPPLARAVREAIRKQTAIAPDGEQGLASLWVEDRECCYRMRTAPILRHRSVAGTVTVLEDVTRLRQLDRLKDEFISVASHELRTPLTSMQMSVQLLAEGSAGPLSPRQERLVRMVAADAERLEQLTKDLLDLTRLEAGAAVRNRRPVSPVAVVELALGPLRPQADEKGVALGVHVDPSLPLVSTDLEQISRVVTNLVSNAIRHTPAGGRIEVSAQPERDRLRFTISDTGPGIPREYLPRIFERFVQVPGATAGGAGLGLPIARKIVELHGGAIWAESEPGRGTRFHFTVPLS